MGLPEKRSVRENNSEGSDSSNERCVDQLVKYRQYLETTVEASDGEYEEIGDILNRYATLVDTNNDLKGQVRNAEVEVCRTRLLSRSASIGPLVDSVINMHAP